MEGDNERPAGRFIEKPELRRLSLDFAVDDKGRTSQRLHQLGEVFTDFISQCGRQFGFHGSDLVRLEDGNYRLVIEACAKEAELHELAQWVSYIIEEVDCRVHGGSGSYRLAAPAAVRATIEA
ncbi:MAG TPA: hypothetical protein VFL81_02655 [Candidatus Saccharimonadales bacterium]|nr:hypothetical protein [Candidatus Saccharimonadales bacterium]